MDVAPGEPFAGDPSLRLREDAPTLRGVLGWPGYLALAVGAVLLFALVAGSAVLTVRNRAGLDRATHTRAELSALNDMSIAVITAETSQRGYLLTGKPSYLQPYDAAVIRLPQAFAAAQRELGQHSGLMPQFTELQSLTAAKMAELARTVALAQSGRRDEALALVQTDFGKDAMDRIHTVYQEIRHSQLATFERELVAVKQRGAWVIAVDLAGVVGLLAMASVVAASLRRALGKLGLAQGALVRANDELGQLNNELEQRVADRTAELTEANAEMQRFAYIVSHDLRAPLVNIMGFTAELEAATGLIGRTVAELAEHRKVPPEVTQAGEADLPEAIRFIKASTAKMDRLIAAILKLSREGRRVLSTERVNMHALFASIADSLQHQIQQAGAGIEIGPVPDIDGDRLVLEQIFGNLIDNALKYRAPGRPARIRVTGEQRGGETSFTVSDNGRGIAPRDRDRIFDLFRRAGDQTVPGEGIGLAHVRALVRRLGGRIELQSTPDVGSSFRVHFPGPKLGSRSGPA